VAPKPYVTTCFASPAILQAEKTGRKKTVV